MFCLFYYINISFILLKIKQQSLTITVGKELGLGLSPEDQRWIHLSRGPGQIQKTYINTHAHHGMAFIPERNKKKKNNEK